MKLLRAHISNFRCIADLDLDFRDALGRPRPLTVISGPNTSGKTSILEAIGIALGAAQDITQAAPDLAMVRWGTVGTEVTCELRLGPDEVGFAREVMRRRGGAEDEVPDTTAARVSWQYPDPRNGHLHGHLQWEPATASRLLQARKALAVLLATRAAQRSELSRLGRFYSVEQERAGPRLRLPQFAARAMGLSAGDGGNPLSPHGATIEQALVALGIAHTMRAGNGGEADSPDEYATVCETFAALAPPHRIVRVEPNDQGYRVVFSDGRAEYGSDALSSGQRALLRLLLELTLERIDRSVVAIDELELHLHPAWQTQLLLSLPGIGVDNQYIVTTHSEHIRGLAARDALIELGSLA